MKLFVVTFIAIGCMVAFGHAKPAPQGPAGAILGATQNLAGAALGTTGAVAGALPAGAQFVNGVQNAVNPALLQANAAAANSGGALSDLAASTQNVGLGLKGAGGLGVGAALGFGQGAAQGAGGALTGGIKGLTDGLSKGDIFGGLINGFTGAIKGGTSGVVNGASKGFLSGLGGTLGI